LIELLVVEEVEKDVYENLDNKTDTHYQTNMVVVDKDHTVEVVDEDMKQEMVPKVDMLHWSNGKCGGQEGGAKDTIVPKTSARCEECQFNMEMKDEVSAQRVLKNHMFVAHTRQEQNHQQQLCGKGGAEKGRQEQNSTYHKSTKWWGRTKV
jgi:hypothetical protein